MGENELVWLGLSIDVASKIRNFEAGRRLAPGKVQLLPKLKNPAVNQVQSATGYPNGSRKCVHGCVLFFGMSLRFLRGSKRIRKLAKNSRLRV